MPWLLHNCHSCFCFVIGLRWSTQYFPNHPLRALLADTVIADFRRLVVLRALRVALSHSAGAGCAGCDVGISTNTSEDLPTPPKLHVGFIYIIVLVVW